MTWNYRLVKRHTKNPQSLGGNEYCTYAIHEAYYDSKGKVNGITENPIDLSAEHLNDLMITWDMLSEAFAAPILDYDTIGDDSEEGLGLPTEQELEDSIPMEEVFENLGLDIEPFDSEAYYREEAETNEKEELQHTTEFIGRSPKQIRSLIKTLRSQSPK